jgi:hypothetical protein
MGTLGQRSEPEGHVGRNPIRILAPRAEQALRLFRVVVESCSVTGRAAIGMCRSPVN